MQIYGYFTIGLAGLGFGLAGLGLLDLQNSKPSELCTAIKLNARSAATIDTAEWRFCDSGAEVQAFRFIYLLTRRSKKV